MFEESVCLETLSKEDDNKTDWMTRLSSLWCCLLCYFCVVSHYDVQLLFAMYLSRLLVLQPLAVNVFFSLLLSHVFYGHVSSSILGCRLHSVILSNTDWCSIHGVHETSREKAVSRTPCYPFSCHSVSVGKEGSSFHAFLFSLRDSMGIERTTHSPLLTFSHNLTLSVNFDNRKGYPCSCIFLVLLKYLLFFSTWKVDVDIHRNIQ